MKFIKVKILQPLKATCIVDLSAPYSNSYGEYELVTHRQKATKSLSSKNEGHFKALLLGFAINQLCCRYHITNESLGRPIHDLDASSFIAFSDNAFSSEALLEYFSFSESIRENSKIAQRISSIIQTCFAFKHGKKASPGAGLSPIRTFNHFQRQLSRSNIRSLY
jgi:hypothetical protein